MAKKKKKEEKRGGEGRKRRGGGGKERREKGKHLKRYCLVSSEIQKDSTSLKQSKQIIRETEIKHS